MFEIEGQSGGQTYFYIRKFNEIYMYEVMHKDHYIFKGITKKQIYFLFGRIHMTHIWIKSYTIENQF